MLVWYAFPEYPFILYIFNGYGGYCVGLAVIGVDLGGTNLRAAVLNHEGDILSKHKESTRAAEGRVKVVARLIENIRRQRELAVHEGHEIVAVGVGAPGVIFGDKGIVVKSPNFPDWNNLPLKAELETALTLPVRSEERRVGKECRSRWS